MNLFYSYPQYEHLPYSQTTLFGDLPTLAYSVSYNLYEMFTLHNWIVCRYKSLFTFLLSNLNRFKKKWVPSWIISRVEIGIDFLMIKYPHYSKNTGKNFCIYKLWIVTNSFFDK